jgi:hypothetical protein
MARGGTRGGLAVPRRMTILNSELLMLLSGIYLAGTTRRNWWRQE